jgi:hypothetical protein
LYGSHGITTHASTTAYCKYFHNLLQTLFTLLSGNK